MDGELAGRESVPHDLKNEQRSDVSIRGDESSGSRKPKWEKRMEARVNILKNRRMDRRERF